MIDGRMDDACWSAAPTATSFRSVEPTNGVPAPNTRKTEVRLAYDDNAIYIFARMYDSSPDSILHQYSERDNYNVNTDWFGIFINPFNDGLNDFNFYVTAAGVQTDSRTTAYGDDVSWNTVWESDVRIDDEGWTVEFAIPYRCLRFSEKNPEDWGLNMMRYTRRYRELYSWNFIDRSIATYELQTGRLSGMENIEPPLRLSFMPYVSAYATQNPAGDVESINLGMDLKYGINESFTLDATLIPDFGQVAFDEQFLNLGPFENQFQENRQFFVEGTDLFSKGEMFYSRRIGGTPRNFSNSDLSSLSGTSQNYTRLLNATKVSGRTAGNTGIGVLNAITDNNYLSGRDSTGDEVQILTEPMTNYNVFVIDHRFARNRSVSLINTNVLRSGQSRDANVTALETDLNDHGNVHKLFARAKMSHIRQGDSTINDFNTNWDISRIKGQWRWGVGQSYSGEHFDQNDLGFLTRGNYLNHYATVSKEIFQPWSIFNRYRVTLTYNHEMLAHPNRFERDYFEATFFAFTRNFFAFGGNLTWQYGQWNNYFEAREPGRVFNSPGMSSYNLWISTDYRKPFAIDVRTTFGRWERFDNQSLSLDIKPIVRINDHFNVFYQIIPQVETNNVGWATTRPDSIIFGDRRITTVQQLIGATYVFTPRMTLDLNFRHYWRSLDYNRYGLLSDNGEIDFIGDDFNRDVNFNTLNVDLRFSWWFAPGSELSLLYRNSLIQSSQDVSMGYWSNLEGAFNVPSTHIFSLRLTYFLDYAIFAS